MSESDDEDLFLSHPPSKKLRCEVRRIFRKIWFVWIGLLTRIIIFAFLIYFKKSKKNLSENWICFVSGNRKIILIFFFYFSSGWRRDWGWGSIDSKQSLYEHWVGRTCTFHPKQGLLWSKDCWRGTGSNNSNKESFEHGVGRKFLFHPKGSFARKGRWKRGKNDL